MSSPNLSLARYYDRLTLYGRAARRFRIGGGYGSASVHRALRPKHPNEDPHAVVHALVEAELAGHPIAHLLDAGCGLGGTSLYFAARQGVRCEGVSLSARQVETATEFARAAKLDALCQFRVANFDQQLPDRHYDAIVAIESLAHSPDLGASLANLAKSLAPGGRLLAVDDVRAANANPRDAALFKAGWTVPSFVSHAEWLAAFAQAGLRVMADRDLSAHVLRRPAWRRRSLTLLNALGRAAIPFGAANDVLRSHRGGLALERLYADGGSFYRLFVAL